MREPLESAFLTLLMLGVEFVYGEAKQRSSQDHRFGETEQNKGKHSTLKETASRALVFFCEEVGSKLLSSYLSFKELSHIE